MFRCLKTPSREEIIILDDEWMDDGVERLRAFGKADQLICPECNQPVIVRAGEKKAWHFAHRSLDKCPLKNESPAILGARRILYRWLKAKYADGGRGRVTLEKKLSPNLPRLVDCYVEAANGKRFAYWIQDRGMRNRPSVELVFVRLGVVVNWVFLADVLKPAEDDPVLYDLSATERDFAKPSKYDQMYSSRRDCTSLHYLDEKTGDLTTLRGISLYHKPQRFKVGEALTSPMTALLTSDETGELIHPEEPDALQEYLKEEESKPIRRRRYRDREDGFWAGYSPVTSDTESHAADSGSNIEPPQEPQPKQLDMFAQANQPMTCEACGKETTDWVSAVLSQKTCVCRDCNHRRFQERSEL